jgi:hypothetical protein
MTSIRIVRFLVWSPRALDWMVGFGSLGLLIWLVASGRVGPMGTLALELFLVF